MSNYMLITCFIHIPYLSTLQNYYKNINPTIPNFRYSAGRLGGMDRGG